METTWPTVHLTPSKGTDKMLVGRIFQISSRAVTAAQEVANC